MRIVVAHNVYQQQGGEDQVVKSETSMLRSQGHDVRVYHRHNEDITTMSRMSLVSETFWSRRTTSEFHTLLTDFRPDVIHCHNTFPLISPSIYWAAAANNVPLVQTLHNFRLLCPQAMFLRDNKVCEECLGRVALPSIVHGCYHDSKAQSAVIAGMQTMHRLIGTYAHKVTRYIALTEFCRQKFMAGGLPAESIVVKPNFVELPVPASMERSGFLFVGRLSAEKGVATLVKAADISQHSIAVLGNGPEAHLVQNCILAEFRGSCSHQDVLMAMSTSAALIVPSLWYEGFPMVVVEAFASGLPVIASRIGSLIELIEDGVTGLLFDKDSPADLAAKLSWAAKHPEQMSIMGQNARRKYEAEFTPERNYEQLMAIYEDAIRHTTVFGAAG